MVLATMCAVLMMDSQQSPRRPWTWLWSKRAAEAAGQAVSPTSHFNTSRRLENIPDSKPPGSTEGFRQLVPSSLPGQRLLLATMTAILFAVRTKVWFFACHCSRCKERTPFQYPSST